MNCNICGNETTEAGNAFIALPFGVICEECANEIESTKKDTFDKFQKELQEATLCGACGQYYEENEQGEDAYHSPQFCDAANEICEDCENFTDMPCKACLDEDMKKGLGIK